MRNEKLLQQRAGTMLLKRQYKRGLSYGLEIQKMKDNEVKSIFFPRVRFKFFKMRNRCPVYKNSKGPKRCTWYTHIKRGYLRTQPHS
jgi:hypothetical protein